MNKNNCQVDLPLNKLRQPVRFNRKPVQKVAKENRVVPPLFGEEIKRLENSRALAWRATTPLSIALALQVSPS